MSRPSKRKVSEAHFVKYVLDNMIDSDGVKRSVREFWSDPEFMEYTGFRHHTKKDKPVSVGTMRYHISVKLYDIPVLTKKYGRKYSLCEATLYKYHKEVTGILKPTVDFKTFSREKNNGHRRVVRNTGEMTTEKILRRVGKDLGFILTLEDMDGSVSEFRDYLIFKYGEDDFNEAVSVYE